MRRGDLAAVRKRGLETRSELPVDDGDLVPVRGEIPRGGDADDTRAEYDDAHLLLRALLDRADRRLCLARRIVAVVGDRDAAAEKIAITIDVVDARDRR